MKIKWWIVIFWILIVYIDYYLRFLHDPYVTPFVGIILKKFNL